MFLNAMFKEKVVVCAYKPSTPEAREENCCEIKASLGYISSFKLA